MLSEDLDRIEQQLGLRLPEGYRRTMLDYPFAADSPAEELWLLNDPESLVEVNREYRADGFFGLPWPTTYFAVGGDGGGNAYVLDLASDSARVLIADHEARTIEPIAGEFGAWIEMLQRESAEIAEDARQMEERHRGKQWWQFWR